MSLARLRVGILTDVHVVQDNSRRASWHNVYDFSGVRARLVAAFELFARERADVVLMLGDLAHDGDLASLREALAPALAFAPVAPRRTLVVGGNHDGPRPTERLVEAGVERGRLPGWRARRAVTGADVGIAGVRVVRRARHQWASARPPALATWGDAPVLLGSHFPVLSRAQVVRAAGLPYAGDLVNRERVAAPLLARAAPTVVVCGHLHVREGVADGALLQVACGALIEPPFEATLLDLREDGAGLAVNRTAHELGRAEERRDPRLAPAEEAWRFAGGRWCGAS